MELPSSSDNNHSLTVPKINGEFDWSSQTQGCILGSFYIGYLFTQIPGGIIAAKYGGKWVIGIGVFIASLLSLFIPIAAWNGELWLIAVRGLQGMAEGLVPPAAHVLLSQWSPPDERSQLGSAAFSGNQGGALLGMLLSGLMIFTNQLNGWPAVFYISGGIGIIWCAFWTLFAYNKPWENPDISQHELDYIQRTLAGQISKEYVPPPWISIFQSKTVWAIISAQTGNALGIFTLITVLPTYMHKILHYNLEENGWMSGLPFLGMMIVALFSGHISSRLISGGTSILTVRRIFNSVGHWIPAAAFLSLSFLDCNRIVAVTLIFIGIAFSGAASAGFHVNHIDISPQHAGIIMAICNTVANLFVWAGPVFFMGKMTAEDDSIEPWRILFILVSVILFVDNLIYIWIASGSVQKFNSIGFNINVVSEDQRNCG